MITQNVSGVNIKQINLSFALANFTNASNQAVFYEQYRLKSVRYMVMPLDIVNTTGAPGNFDLVYHYVVPITTATIPPAAQSAYLAFKNVQVNLDNKIHKRSFVPYYQTGSSPNYIMAKAPRMDVANTTQIGFGHSLLFVKKSATVSTFLVQIFVEAQFQFYTFDGQYGVALNKQEIIREIDTFSNKKQAEALLKARLLRKMQPMREVSEEQSSSSQEDGGTREVLIETLKKLNRKI